MKLYEIAHVTERHNPNEIMGAELRFTSIICPMTGEKSDPTFQPDAWDHVRRLTNNLFYAWDDTNPIEGSVFLGVFEEHKGTTKPVDVDETPAGVEQAEAPTGLRPFHTLNHGERIREGDEWRFDPGHPWTKVPFAKVGTAAPNCRKPGNPTCRRRTGPAKVKQCEPHDGHGR